MPGARVADAEGDPDAIAPQIVGKMSGIDIHAL